ncbi:hypothetical protein SPAN111604_03490 [Sphingomonas antarctica]|uniref:hypothetical protein n=1 Tax=Sphingomonas antarctica TaxID=2040274 RepID=UPI0039EACCD9
MKLRAFLGGVVLLAASAAGAAGRCDIESSTGGTSSATYDPFSASPTIANINGVQMIRLRGTGGELATQITYYLKARATGFDGSTLQVVSGSGGGGNGEGYNNNILVAANGAPPPLNNNSPPPAGTFKWNFGNSNGSAGFTLNYRLTLPAGLDTASSTQLVFDLYYRCKARSLDGTQTFDDTGMIPGALGLNLTVRNALQAYFNGQASANTLSFDFGEVGATGTATVAGTPASYTRSGFINVRSSGAYSVSLASDNNFRLTYPGGNPATPAQSLTYSATLLGQTRSGSSGSGAAVSPITRQCLRAGVPAPGNQLPLSVTLTEGGTTKTPAPVYADRLVITIAPIVSTAVTSCP